MAGKNAKSTGKTTQSTRVERAPFVGYVNVILTEEDKLDYDGWVGESDLVAEAYLDALDAGYQFTTKSDPENDCYSCSISNWHVSAPDSGVLYSGRSYGPDSALSKALYVWDRKLARNLNNGAVKNAQHDAF